MVALAWIAVAMAVTLGMLWFFQRSLIYLPSQRVPDPPPGAQEVTYKTEDGLTLSGWLMRVENERGLVIVFNGNAGNRADRLPLGTALVEEGYSVLLTDYRGYGGNPGSPSEDGLRTDARAAHTFVTEGLGISELVYFGESLGAGVAIALAVEETPGALVLRSPFSSLTAVAAHHYWYLPSSLLLEDRFPNVERIGTVEAPVLVVAGSADDVVPTELSREVYEAANEPKRLVIIDGAGHNDAALLDGVEMIQTISAFLAR
jgi:fermentation-respiration switch protein FrsA (DUF1100 family)